MLWLVKQAKCRPPKFLMQQTLACAQKMRGIFWGANVVLTYKMGHFIFETSGCAKRQQMPKAVCQLLEVFKNKMGLLASRST